MTRAALFTVLTLMATSSYAQQATSSLGFVGGETIRKYDNLRQIGVRFRHPLEQRNRWMPRTLDITAGLVFASDKSATFVSLGPSWQHQFTSPNGRMWFLDHGLHPTLISRTNFDGTRIGGSFHFTSHFGVGTYLGRDRQASLAIRYQHTSNAGLRSRNPGIDMVAVVFQRNFGERADQATGIR